MGGDSGDTIVQTLACGARCAKTWRPVGILPPVPGRPLTACRLSQEVVALRSKMARLGLGSAVLVLTGALMMTLVGCGGGSDEGAVAPLSVSITDDDGIYAEVHLSIVAIRVVRTGDEDRPTGPGLPLIAAFSPPRTVDVLDLAFKQELLGTAEVPVGTYQQVRLVLAPNVPGSPPANYITLPDAPLTRIPLDTPSGHAAGLKVLGRFEVRAGVANAIVLDFDPARAIVKAGMSGKYLLKPTSIRIVEVERVLPIYGSLSMTVNPAAVRPTAAVEVRVPGKVDPVAAGSADPDDGFFRAFLPAGDYFVRVAAPGYTPYDTSLLAVPVAFAVATGADTDIGAVTLDPM